MSEPSAGKMYLCCSGLGGGTGENEQQTYGAFGVNEDVEVPRMTLEVSGAMLGDHISGGGKVQ